MQVKKHRFCNFFDRYGANVVANAPPITPMAPCGDRKSPLIA
jgi:hypothetical protein